MSEPTSKYATYIGGPANVGDPDCRYIGSAERSSILSRFIQEKLLTELCRQEWKDWRACIRNSSSKLLAPFRCRNVYKVVEECQNKYILDPDQMKKFEDEYLDIRSEYRRTGVGRSFMSREKMTEFLSDKDTDTTTTTTNLQNQ